MSAVVAIKDSTKLFLWNKDQDAKLSDAIGNKASIGDIGGDGAEEIDVTNMEGDSKQYELGFIDPGSFDITQFLSTDEYSKMSAYLASGETLNWGILVNNRSGEKVLGLQGQGLVKSVKLTGLSVGSAIQVVTTIRCSGSITSDFETPAQ